MSTFEILLLIVLALVGFGLLRCARGIMVFVDVALSVLEEEEDKKDGED